jgi:tetratricopeptide (TPR) repeat protein
VPILNARELFASAQCFEGDARRGLDEYRGIVADLEARLGPMHSRLAAAYNDRAGAQYQCGDSEGALASLQRCMAIEEAAHGPDTQHMRQGRAGVGGVLVNEGRFEQGLALLKQAYDEFAAHEGAHHPITRVALDRYIAGLIKAGMLEEAEQRLEEFRVLCEGDAAALDEWRQQQAQLLRSRGRYDEALSLLEPMQQRRLASPMLHTRAVASGVLGGVRVDAGRHAEALEPLERAIEIFSGRHPFGSAAIARARVDLGRAQLGLGDVAAAVLSLREALAYWDEHGPDRSPAAEAAGWLALALHARGEREAACECARRACRGPWRTELDRIARLQQSLVAAGLAP